MKIVPPIEFKNETIVFLILSLTLYKQKMNKNTYNFKKSMIYAYSESINESNV